MTLEQQMNVRYQLVETLANSAIDGLSPDTFLPFLQQVEGYILKDVPVEDQPRQSSLNLVN